VHQPVLLAEVIRSLDLSRGGCIVDCTVGLGGHAAEILSSSPAITLLGLDRDPQALELASRRLTPFGDRARLVGARFDQLRDVVAEQGIDRISGVLADLGVSSLQLDGGERGFSFRLGGPLDMRMGLGSRREDGEELTAGTIVNHYPEAELTRIFRQYGEERHAPRIAKEIVAARKAKAIETTSELSRLVERVKPFKRQPRIHRRPRSSRRCASKSIRSSTSCASSWTSRSGCSSARVAW